MRHSKLQKKDLEKENQARPSEIVQVLVNLLNNSYDAIESQPRGWARISLTLAAHDFHIEVTDSGAEIELEVAQKMMEPFFTTKMTGKGTGLGLSVSKQIIQSHNGELFYDPTSENTRFVFTLPKV
jgi:C4-dicarboxylate-specific signal transduction histidine kinase